MNTLLTNRVRDTIKSKAGNILNIYFTAGYPSLNDTVSIIRALDRCDVDLIELGMPYSDPLADGPTIQNSSEKAIKNGMTISILFDQVKEARKHSAIPIILMGYYNQILQYGVERFVQDASLAGIDGLIIPDLPMLVYEEEYMPLFIRHHMSISFLISPMTGNDRIKMADRLSSGFIYIVSQNSITGKSQYVSEEQLNYFERIKNLKLQSPTLIGFGIHDKKSFLTACHHSHGAIIGSAFIRALNQAYSPESIIPSFIQSIRT
ncbi:MAG TPA: tryptophan synthase subunit alpha [Saprospiraceae bacterium]|nr:tryptophan synthase subunit alpha [Saprospiraceae bacterium]